MAPIDKAKSKTRESVRVGVNISIKFQEIGRKPEHFFSFGRTIDPSESLIVAGVRFRIWLTKGVRNASISDQ